MVPPQKCLHLNEMTFYSQHKGQPGTQGKNRVVTNVKVTENFPSGHYKNLLDSSLVKKNRKKYASLGMSETS